MKIKRNGLRPVTFNIHGKSYDGYFHCFSQEGDYEDGIGLYAAIETVDGTIKQVDAYAIKFEDVESLSDDE